jgi:hypothetical protein
MKFSMNMLLWTDSVLDEKFLPLLERLADQITPGQLGLFVEEAAARDATLRRRSAGRRRRAWTPSARATRRKNAPREDRKIAYAALPRERVQAIFERDCLALPRQTLCAG